MRRRRGIALLTILVFGVILTILAVSLLSMYLGDYAAQRSQQQAVQAYWNARSAVERFSQSRQLPDGGSYDWGSSGSCRVVQAGSDLLFTGRCGTVERRIRLIGRDPGRRLEE